MASIIKEKKEIWSDKIEFLRESKKFFSKMKYRGINLWPVMAPAIYESYVAPVKNKKESAKDFFRYFFLQERIKFPEVGGSGILASFAMNRKDHHEFFLKSIEKLKENVLLIDMYGTKNKDKKDRFSLRFPNVILFLKLLINFNKNSLKKVLDTKYWSILAHTTYICSQIKRFERKMNEYNLKAYVSFCSQASEEETIITLISKKNNVPTFTLQHGFIIDYPYFGTPVLLSENNVSDYILVWGKSTERQLLKFIDKGRIVKAGNPKYDRPHKIRKENLLKIGTVFLSVVGNEESNKNLVRIIDKICVKKPEININIKIHPFDKIDKYSSIVTSKNIKFVDKNVSVKELLEKSDFTIVHNTTISYEALLYGIPILKFKDGHYAKLWDDRDSFIDLKDLETLLNKLKTKKFAKSLLDYYSKILEETFYFHPTKTVPEVYREKIIEKVKD